MRAALRPQSEEAAAAAVEQLHLRHCHRAAASPQARGGRLLRVQEGLLLLPPHGRVGLVGVEVVVFRQDGRDRSYVGYVWSQLVFLLTGYVLEARGFGSEIKHALGHAVSTEEFHLSKRRRNRAMLRRISNPG